MTSITAKDPPRRALRTCARRNVSTRPARNAWPTRKERLDLALADAGWHRLPGLLAVPLYSNNTDAADLAGAARHRLSRPC